MKHSLFIIVALFIANELFAQNVGIGTTTPTENLEVIGRVKVSSLAGSGSRVLLSNPSGLLFNVNPGQSGQVLTSIGGSAIWQNLPTGTSGWALNGNSGTNSFSSFIGTTDAEHFNFRTNNLKRMGITSGGGVHVGTFSYASAAHFQVVTEGVFQTGLANFMRPSTINLKFGISNRIETDPGEAGSLYGIDNSIRGDGDQAATGISSNITLTGSGLKYGIYNRVADAPGGMMGLRQDIGRKSTSNQPGDEPGQITAIYNGISNSNTDTKYGTRNFITTSNGLTYGVHNNIQGGNASSSIVYGTYNTVTSQSPPGSVAGYFNAYGTGNVAAIFDNGSVIMNEVGFDNDIRIETENNEHALFVDANQDLVRFGANDGFLPANGTVVNGVTQTYVADFDIGGGNHSGTTIGIGSTEYLVDYNNEISINGGFSPLTHTNKDLGYSTTERAWDDVFADDFVNVSDKREKSNITNLTYGLDEVLKMRPVTYTLNRDPNQESKVGLIAQEVLPLVPEAVKTHDHKILDENNPEMQKVELERMGMTYQTLIPVLINATQEQQKLIEIQQKQIDSLKDELNNLKEKMKE